MDYLHITHNASASAVYRDTVKSSASPHYHYRGVGKEKRNNEVGGGDCPSIFARRLAIAISEDFLKKTNMKTSSLSQAVVDSSKKNKKPSLCITEVTMCRILKYIFKEITKTLKEKLSENIFFTLNLTDDDVQDFTPMPTTTKRPSTVSTFQDMAM